jgi:hypothetical protein
MSSIKVRAVKDSQLVSSVADDTKWTRKKIVYGPAPRGVHVLTEKASITVYEGREDCGSGRMILDSVDEIRACDANYRRGTLIPTVEGRWANYGAPHGTHTDVKIVWAFVADPVAAK